MKAKRTTIFYIANLGSELSRAVSLAKKKDLEASKSAFERSEAVLEKIMSEGSETAQQEMAILKEVIADLKDGGEKFSVTSEDLENYFMPFALLVTKEQA